MYNTVLQGVAITGTFTSSSNTTFFVDREITSVDFSKQNIPILACRYLH